MGIGSYQVFGTTPPAYLACARRRWLRRVAAAWPRDGCSRTALGDAEREPPAVRFPRAAGCV